MVRTHAPSTHRNATRAKATTTVLKRTTLLATDQDQLADTQPQRPSFRGISQELITPAEVGVQAKLTIGAANDKYEKEADKVAVQVVKAIHKPQIQPTDSLYLNSKSETLLRNLPPIQAIDDRTSLQMKPMLQQEGVAGSPVSEDFANEIRQARSSGQALPLQVRTQMEWAMGADFSEVRVHADTRADELNQAIQAKAFTTGQHIFFRNEQYKPKTHEGQALLAHELTHVVQQSANWAQKTESSETPDKQHHSNYAKWSGQEIIQCMQLTAQHKEEIIVCDAAIFSQTGEGGMLFRGDKVKIIEVNDIDNEATVEVIDATAFQAGATLTIKGNDFVLLRDFQAEQNSQMGNTEEDKGDQGKEDVNYEGYEPIDYGGYESIDDADYDPIDYTETGEQTAAHSLEVTRISGPQVVENKEAKKLTIYYDKNEWNLADEVKSKVAEAIKRCIDSSKPTILGSRSEEENAGVEKQRVEALLEPLLTATENKKYEVKTWAADRFNGKIRYREMRKVEIAATGTVQNDSSDLLVQPPETVQKKFTEVKRHAIAMVAVAINKIGTKSGRELKTYMGLNADPTEIVTNLNYISDHIKNDLTRVLLMTKYNAHYDSAVAYNDRAETPTICVHPDFETGDTQNLALVLIHEASHSTPQLQTQDHVYGYERMIKLSIPPDVAKMNADSYALLVRSLNSNEIWYGETPPEDEYSGVTVPDTTKEAVYTTLAEISRTLIAAGTLVRSAYQLVVAGRDTDDDQALTETRVKSVVLLYEICKNVDVTTKIALDFLNHDWVKVANANSYEEGKNKLGAAAQALAAIHDRIDMMGRALEHEGVQVTVEESEEAQITWQPGPARAFTISTRLLQPRTQDRPKVKERIFEALMIATGFIPSEPWILAAYRDLFVACERINAKH